MPLISTLCRPAALLRSVLPSRVFNSISVRNLSKQIEKGKFEVEEGVKLYWEKHGHGPHVVLFLPGLCGSIQMNYWPVFQKMDHDKFTMIGVDPLGYGKSYPPVRDAFTDQFCLERDAMFAGNIVQGLGYDKYSVVGWSNGGISAVLLGLLQEDNVISVVVCNGPFNLNKRSNLVMDQISNLKNWELKHRRNLFRYYDEKYAVKILKDWQHFTKKETEKPHHFLNTLMRAQMLRRPLRYIYGTRDAFMNAREAFEILDQFSSLSCDLRFVRNGTHFHLDFLDEFVEHVTDFLEEQKVDQVVNLTHAAA